MSMRTLEQMRYDDAKQTVREAEDIQEERPLTFEEAALLSSALMIVREVEGSNPEKDRRREEWKRRKGQARLKELRRASRRLDE